jgi:catechol 2,3-dioxygenase-like lactoylglutathione lyase family enzyme
MPPDPALQPTSPNLLAETWLDGSIILPRFLPQEEIMKLHRGRLVDHVHLRVSNLEVSKSFYRAILAALDLPDVVQEGPGFFFADELFVDEASDYITRVHLAFQASSRDAVHAFYDAALAAGGGDNGPPGERAYHPGYYAAFALDPDGNNIEGVFHGPSNRSAPSVVIEPK